MTAAAHPIAGTGVFLLGGLAAATYLLPFRAVKGWAYETGWMICVLAGWAIFPLVFDLLAIPDFAHVLASADAPTLLRTAAFGALWGVGALCWALMVRYLGIGLGLAIGAGLCAAAGTLLPPIASGAAHSLVATAGAQIVLAGVAVSLCGIVCVGLAGHSKEGEIDEATKKRAVAEFDFRKGIVAAIVAGLASAGINFGLQGAPALEKAALDAGASPTWAGMPVLTVVLWGGIATQLAWGAVQHCRNRSFGNYVHGPLLRNYLLSALVGVIGVMQFVLQKAGEPLMGEFRYISFAALMSSAVLLSALLGIFLGEWRGTGRRTRLMLAIGTLLLTASFCIMSYGGNVK